MNINYEHLKVFYHVAMRHSFTQAAIELGTSQPAVTRLINSLEGQLGCRLFFRNRHDVSLTPEGQQLYDYVSLGFEQIEKGLSAIGDLSTLERGKLVITSNEIALRGFVDEILDIFHQKYPHVTINLKNVPSATGLQQLDQGISDFAFITSVKSVNKSYHQLICRVFHDVPIIGAAYRDRLPSDLHLKDLLNFPYICMSQGHNTYDIYNDFFKQNGLAMNIDMTTDSFALIMPMLEHNLGYAFMPEFIAEESIQKGLVIRPNLHEKMEKREIRMLYNAAAPMSVAGTAFLHTAQEYIKNRKHAR